VGATNPEITKILEVIQKIHGGFKICTKKIVCASKFIDYFVHDMLDYTILNKGDKNFVKIIESFDIRNTIDEIIEIQEDKIQMKGIEIVLKLQGFENTNYMVMTDQKRVQ
jgi:hypothetical protein